MTNFSPTANAATATISIVDVVPEHSVALGLVTSLARPDGDLTGIDFFASGMTAKPLELPREEGGGVEFDHARPNNTAAAC